MSDAKSFCRFSLAAVIALLVLSTAWDARANGCKPIGKVCSTPISCCSGNCAKPISKKATALFGICCATGESVCGTSCKNLSSDNQNCGTCGKTCAANETCVNKVCTCVRNCMGKSCGDDGCGGSCGTCDGVCDQGTCVTTTTTTSTVTTTITTTSTTLEADLSLGKVASVPAISQCVTSSVTFTVTLHNGGPGTATGVEVTDEVMPPFTCISGSTSHGTYSCATGKWSVGDLLSGSDATLGIMTQANCCDASSTTYHNTATVTAADQTDPDSGDLTAMASVFFACD
jgi:uncharacterized repeat protein (TIGR01451 family)